VTVLPGNAQDRERALELVAGSEANTGCAAAETLADGAYGDGETRQAFADAGRRLVARVPAEQNGGRFTKGDFTLDLEAGTCDCPGGQQSRDFWPRPGGGGLFRFAPDVCAACPLRAQCVKGQGGRSVRVHPQEGLLQAARAEQAGPTGRELRTRRQAVEHRIARLVQLGIRQARYIGRTKTRFQLLLAATVANLTLLANTDTASGDAMVVAGAVCALLAALLATWSHPHSPERPRPNPRRPAPSAALAALLPTPSWHITRQMATSRPGF
jgi:DDE family transposase